MKKFFTLAASLLVAGSALAASPTLNSGRLFVKPNVTSAIDLPATTNNDDSCDIAVTPAATLLLPYFEVDPVSPANAAVNTLFTITNTSSEPQIVHLTVWTDWSFPVLDFNVFLSGYDVQGINLYDILNRGVIPPTGMSVSPQGDLSDDNVDGNPNFAASASDACDSLPGPIGETLRAAIVSALTTGEYTGCTGLVGGTHTNAVGYVTADVVNTCSQALPTDPAYYSSVILFDNTLIGDYQRIDPVQSATAKGFAGGNPMVHIRAIPEGGPVNGPARGTPTTFPFTFYDRYTPSFNREADRRQPLPSVWAARYIDRADATDPLNFGTSYAIWREGVIRDPSGTPTCSAVDSAGRSQYKANRNMSIQRIVRFDESENPSLGGTCQVSPCPPETTFSAPETSLRSVSNTAFFPADNTGTDDAGGWMYLNLSNPDAPNGDTGTDVLTDRDNGSGVTTQNWVVIEMTAEGRYGVDFDAAYLGNGCSPNPGPDAVIGPLDNITTLPDEVN